VGRRDHLHGAPAIPPRSGGRRASGQDDDGCGGERECGEGFLHAFDTNANENHSQQGISDPLLCSPDRRRSTTPRKTCSSFSCRFCTSWSAHASSTRPSDSRSFTHSVRRAMRRGSSSAYRRPPPGSTRTNVVFWTCRTQRRTDGESAHRSEERRGGKGG